MKKFDVTISGDFSDFQNIEVIKHNDDVYVFSLINNNNQVDTVMTESQLTELKNKLEKILKKAEK